MGGKILQKWDLQPPFNPYNYRRGRVCTKSYFNHLSTNPTKWPNTLKQKFINKLSTNCLSMFDHFVRLAYGDTTQFVCLWKKISKASSIFSVHIYAIYSVNTGKDNVQPENIKKPHQMNLLRSFEFKSCILKFQLQKILVLNQAEVLNKN